MWKRKVGVLLVMLCILCCGCTPKEVVQPFVAEDFQRGNSGVWSRIPVMETDKGYYYHEGLGNGHKLRYVDKETGKDIYLCNKPECKHDGNEFCVATKDTFCVSGYCLYSDRILISAVEETETRYEYKLLSASLDGSQLTEVVTYYSTEKNGLTPYFMFDITYLNIHRNRALLPMTLKGSDDETNFYGVAFVNLDTMEVSYYNEEEPVSKMSEENMEWSRITACGDFFYYWVLEGHKKILYRRNIYDGATDIMNLLINFTGEYVVYDEDTIFYTRSLGNHLSIYHIAEDKNEEVDLIRVEKQELADGQFFINNWDYEASEIITDGTYVYVGEGIRPSFFWWEMDKEILQYTRQVIHVFDQNGTELQAIPVDMELMKERETEKEIYFTGSMYFLGDKIMLKNSTSMYECSTKDYVSGNPTFTKVYDIVKDSEEGMVE